MPTAEKTKQIFKCDCCGEDSPKNVDQPVETDAGELICNMCFIDHYSTCPECYRVLHGDSYEWGDGGYCVNCESQEEPWRDWNKNKDLLSKKKGEVLQTTRAFGIELEAGYNEELQINKALGDIHDDIGVYPDSGAEFQTPPASGDKAESIIVDLCLALKKNKFTMGVSQGLHVHVDASDVRDLTPFKRFRAIQELWLFYIVFDPIIRKMIPNSRRNNSMCSGTRDGYTEVRNAASEEELEAIWYEENNRGDINYRKSEQKDSSRYRGVNMHSLFNDWHLEIRYHEGTTSEKAILEWANVHCLIMDNAAEGIPLEWLDYVRGLKIGKRKEFRKFLGLSKASKDYWNNRQRQCAA